MKCDELKSHTAYNRWIDEGWPTPKDDLICGKYYIKAEVDEAIAELKARNVMFHDEAKRYKAENRRLRMALYKACANWAKSFKTTAEMLGAHADAVKWDKMEYKCLAKAEEYK